MDNKLHELLGELSEIEIDISCMVQMLESLKSVYEFDEQKETRSCIQMFSTWAKSLEKDVAAVGNRLDKILVVERELNE